MEKRDYKEGRHEERRSQVRIKRQISIVEGQNKSSRHVNAKKGQLNTALAGPFSLCDFMICSQMTLHTVNFFSAFKPSKYLQLISNTVLYVVVYVQVNHLRSWEKWLFKSNFLICERRTRLQSAILRRSTENSTTPLKKWLSNFSGSDLPMCHFSLQLPLTSIYQHKPQSHLPLVWEPHSATYCNIALTACVSNSIFALLMRNKIC